MKKYFIIKNWVLGLVLSMLAIVNSYAQTVNLTTHQPTGSPPTGGVFEWHNALPISAANKVSNATATSAPMGMYYGVYNMGTCYSKPNTLRAVSNTCPAISVNLNNYVDATTVPSGMTTTFHNSSPVSDATRLVGTAITQAPVGTYFVAFRDNTNGCYGMGSVIVVVDMTCCPTLVTVAGNNANPTTCGGSDGNIKICGMTAGSTGWTVSYDKDGTAATPLTAQMADASGCITITGLTAGAYTNIIVTHATNCPAGSNSISATLSDPAGPTAPVPTATTLANTCPTATADLTSLQPAAVAGQSYEWHTVASSPTVATLVSTPAAVTTSGTYYLYAKSTTSSCYSGASASVVVTITSCGSCPTLTNISGNNVNPTSCGGSNGSIKICGITASSTGWTVSYDKNGTAATPLTGQAADASGCITISGLTAGAYTNIKVTHATNCPAGSNGISATLTDPTAPTTPVPTATTLANSCPTTTANLTSLQPATVAGQSYEWHTASSNPTATNLVATPATASAGTYYLYAKNTTSSCFSGASNAVVVNITSCSGSCNAGNTAPTLTKN